MSPRTSPPTPAGVRAVPTSPRTTVAGSAPVSATPDSQSPTPPAASGTACDCRSGAAAGTAPRGARQWLRQTATCRSPRPANCWNPGEWCRSISASQCRRSSARTGRTSPSRTCTADGSKSSVMACTIDHRSKKSQSDHTQSTIQSLPASVKWPCCDSQDDFMLMEGTVRSKAA